MVFWLLFGPQGQSWYHFRCFWTWENDWKWSQMAGINSFHTNRAPSFGRYKTLRYLKNCWELDFQTTQNRFLMSQNIEIDTWFVMQATRVAELPPFPARVSWLISTSLWNAARKRHRLRNEMTGARQLRYGQLKYKCNATHSDKKQRNSSLWKDLIDCLA